ncbi:unnamed protein product [Oncorhynchus mykiss]|uniref:Uncharacterized protein n=1 Tax=Oncorhynchus mykiss TaxID=8022 RepID=A0A060X889_ONCMY|nr:unnamed protein product [Oncorhynchus mykiss]
MGLPCEWTSLLPQSAHQHHILEIHNLSIGQSEFELKPGKGTEIAIFKVSAVSKGTIQYENGSWLVNVGHSVDFEIESHIDLGINPKLCKYIFLSIVFVVFNVHSHSHSPQELKGIL